MSITADIMDPCDATARHFGGDFSIVRIRDDSDISSSVTIYFRGIDEHERAAEEIAAVINKWCNPNNSLAGTCEKLLAEEEKRRKAEPIAIDERFMERVE